MKINAKGLQLIKDHEGLVLEPYICPAGHPTIGYGHLIRKDENFTRITEAEAEALLLEDVKEAIDGVNRFIKVELNPNQFAALVSFTFNLGSGSLRRSTLLRKLNEGDYQAAAVEFDRWVYGGGEVLPGLVKRRADERKLFLKPHLKPIVQSKTLGGSAIAAAGVAVNEALPSVSGFEWIVPVVILIGITLVVYSRLKDRRDGKV